MTHRNDQSDQPMDQDTLDHLLRQWHEQNRSTAAASRDKLLARVAKEKTSHAPSPPFQQAQHASGESAGNVMLVKLALWRMIMHRYTRVAASLLLVFTVLALLFPPVTQQSVAQSGVVMLPDGGRLDAFDAKGNHIGPCPLRHTDVDVSIAGHFSRTTVTQQYHNPYDFKVEAVYTFPLGHNGAVDRMTMTIGDRVIEGEVKERELARQTYEAARDQGYVASLLEQERPNIFTQSVANIEPGAEITIEISYVEVLESVDGEYTFVFPMVVAPRYIPGSPLGPQEPGTFAQDTDQVDDASRVTPMPAKPDVRAGHDIAVRVRLETGGPGIAAINSGQHDVVQFAERHDGEKLTGISLALKAETEIPNRDFILSWKQQGDGIEEAIFTHTGEYGDYSGGFFTMILQPPHRVSDEQARPRELIFVMDNSGSMRGARLDQGYSALDAAKEVINKAIDTMRPNDRFNVISFNNTLATLWDEPRPNTPENRAIAQRFVDQRQGGGGTEMANAVFAALGANQFGQDGRGLLTAEQLANLPADGRRVSVRAHQTDVVQEQFRHQLRVNDEQLIDVHLIAQIPLVARHLQLDGRWMTRAGRRVFMIDRASVLDDTDDDELMRIVLFVTDGLVGNDEAIIRAVRDHSQQSRMFTIGMSRSPNRYLLDKMAEAGRGAADYVLPGDDVSPIVQRFADRIATPVLTDISLSFDGVEVVDVMPGLDRLPDLFDFSPLVIHGRYTDPGSGSLTIRGRTGAGPYQRTLDLEFPADQRDHDVSATLWARANIDQRMIDDDKQTIIALGEQFQIMSKYTSFVAVEKQRKTIDGESVLVRVPIEFPEGMAWEGVFGSDRGNDALVDSVRGIRHSPPPPPRSAPSAPGRQSRSAAATQLTPPPSSPSFGSSSDEERARDQGYGFAAGGGGGGGGGGGLFGEPGQERSREEPMSKRERRLVISDIVTDLVAPNAWQEFGGDLVTMQRSDGLPKVHRVTDSAEARDVANRATEFLDRYEPIFSGTALHSDAFKGVGYEESPENLATLTALHEQTIKIGFDAVPLERAIGILQDETGLEIKMDWRDGPRTHIVTLPKATRTIVVTLNALVETQDPFSKPMIVVRDGTIVITGDEAARREAHVVVYDIRDLIAAAMSRGSARFEPKDQIVGLLSELVDPYGWREMGGETGSVHALDHWLFIENTTEIHRAIEHLFTQLRAALGLAAEQRVYGRAIDDGGLPVRIYTLDAILGDKPSSEAIDQVIGMIMSRVDTNGWRDHGGDVSTMLEFASLLVIATTPENHSAIDELLRDPTGQRR